MRSMSPSLGRRIILAVTTVLLLGGVAIAFEARGHTSQASGDVQDTLTFIPVSFDKVPYSVTYSLAYDSSSSSLWVPCITFDGTGNQLLRYDTSNGQTETVALPAEPGYPNHTAVAASNRYVWVSWSDVLVRYDKVLGSVSSFDLPAVQYPFDYAAAGAAERLPEKVADWPARHMAVDSNGDVWFTRESANSVFRADGKTGMVQEFRLPGSFGVPDRIVLAPDGSIWLNDALSFTDGNPEVLAGYTGLVSGTHLGRYDPATGSLRVWYMPNSSLQYARGKIYVQARDSVIVMDPSKGTTAAVGIKGDPLGAMLVEPDGGVVTIGARGALACSATGQLARSGAFKLSRISAPDPSGYVGRKDVVADIRAGAAVLDKSGVAWATVPNYNSLVRFAP